MTQQDTATAARATSDLADELCRCRVTALLLDPSRVLPAAP